MSNSIKGFKAFDPGLVCRGFQYKEGETFSIPESPSICDTGFHFCTNPFDVLEYYPLIRNDGKLSEFAEVEALGEVESHGNKSATNRIKIGAKLDLPGFIKASFDFLWQKCREEPNTEVSDGDGARLASSGYGAQLASSGDGAQLASSGDGARLASSGDGARLASSGYGAQLASSGYGAQLASSGYGAQLASSGYGAQLASSGDGARLASSGYGAQLASSGDGAQLASSGDGAQLASSGYGAQINVDGSRSVAATVGHQGRIKGVLGTWITLAEWRRDDEGWYPACVRSAQIDGEVLKADTWYQIVDGEFTEVDDE